MDKILSTIEFNLADGASKSRSSLANAYFVILLKQSVLFLGSTELSHANHCSIDAFASKRRASICCQHRDANAGGDGDGDGKMPGKSLT